MDAEWLIAKQTRTESVPFHLVTVSSKASHNYVVLSHVSYLSDIYEIKENITTVRSLLS